MLTTCHRIRCMRRHAACTTQWMKWTSPAIYHPMPRHLSPHAPLSTTPCHATYHPLPRHLSPPHPMPRYPSRQVRCVMDEMGFVLFDRTSSADDGGDNRADQPDPAAPAAAAALHGGGAGRPSHGPSIDRFGPYFIEQYIIMELLSKQATTLTMATLTTATLTMAVLWL